MHKILRRPFEDFVVGLTNILLLPLDYCLSNRLVMVPYFSAWLQHGFAGRMTFLDVSCVSVVISVSEAKNNNRFSEMNVVQLSNAHKRHLILVMNCKCSKIECSDNE